MTHQRRWLALALVGLVWGGVARADHHDKGMKGLTMSGSAEAGYGHNWATGRKDSTFLLDHAAFGMNAEVSDKTKLVFSHAVAMQNSAASAASTANATASYFPGQTILASGTTFAWAVTNAYVNHKMGDNWSTSVGFMKTSFGMEGLHSRYDMPTYYYSAAYTMAQGAGWNYDLGIKFELVNILPGTLEIAVLDGRVANLAGEALAPSQSLRWWMEMKGGDWTFTPVVSAYLGRWHGGPEDMGITAGGMFKMGTLWTNAEFLYTSRNLTPAATTRAKNLSAYIEPGVDLGVAQVGVKGEWNSVDPSTGSTSDFNVGVSVGHTYNEKYRIRAVYQHAGLGGKIGGHTNDFRILFGTKW